MIKNERQYRITRAQAERFALTLAQLEREDEKVGSHSLHPLLLLAQKEALRSQLDSLRKELADYEALRSGERRVFIAGSLDGLPGALIQARIASGLSQKDLARRLGLKEQQIQRYESTEYASASLERVRAVVHALGVTVHEEISLAGAAVGTDRRTPSH